MNEIKYRVITTFAHAIERECIVERLEDTHFPSMMLCRVGPNRVGGTFTTESEALASADALAREDARNLPNTKVSLNGVHL